MGIFKNIYAIIGTFTDETFFSSFFFFFVIL